MVNKLHFRENNRFHYVFTHCGKYTKVKTEQGRRFVVVAIAFVRDGQLQTFTLKLLCPSSFIPAFFPPFQWLCVTNSPFLLYHGVFSLFPVVSSGMLLGD
jgi:hypothetical protein